MILARHEQFMLSFVLTIIGGVCLLGVFYLVTRFSSMYLTFQGIQGHKLIFGIILIVVILYLPNGLVGLIQSGWRKLKGVRRAHT